MTTKRKIRSLKRVPSLPPEKLAEALEKADALPLPRSQRDLLKTILLSASNPNSERPGAVIMGMPHERRANVEDTRASLFNVTGGIVRGGAQRLRALSDSEWHELVEGDA